MGAKAQRVAVVVVHGVAPHPRYEFQDQVAGMLRDRFNSVDDSAGSDAWVVDVVNPAETLKPGEDEPQPTISRVHRANDTAVGSTRDVFDVIEAYWSPIDKGRTNWFYILRWILRSVFTPINTTARYIASWQKQVYDYLYIGGALVLAFVLFAISLSFVWQSLATILTITGLTRPASAGSLVERLNANVNASGGIPIKIIVWLLVGVAGAYLLTQAAKAVVLLVLQRRTLYANRVAILHRVLSIAVLACIGIGLVYQMATAQFPDGRLGWVGSEFLVIIFVTYELGRALLIDFLVGFFGDTQIYCTHDENSAFFDLRERIIDTAVDAARRAISPSANGGVCYDRVVILAHSLGATIAMDAIIRLYQLKEQGGILHDDFRRIRSLITLGASLEKTKFFFDVATASQSQSFTQWRNDVYGSLFTDDVAVLGKRNAADTGIFWVNYWYFEDPICNKIESYRSYLQLGEELSEANALRAERRFADGEYAAGKLGIRGRIICRNEQGHKRISPFHPMLHSDYLYDDWFWLSSDAGRKKQAHLGALDVIAPSRLR